MNDRNHILGWRAVSQRSAEAMEKRLEAAGALDFAYSAGLFDGEACITLEAPGVSSTGVRKSGRVRVLVYMTTPDVLSWLKETFGGRFYERKSLQPHQKPVHYWGISGVAAALLLQRLEPYMRVKQAQTRCALEFYEEQQNRPEAWVLDQGYKERLLALKEQMLALNKRGAA